MANLPLNPGEALWIGGTPGKSFYNIGIGQGTSGGNNHIDYAMDLIEDGSSPPVDSTRFYLNDAGNVIFRINASAGRTSANTAHPRCELRELTQSGGKAKWDGRSGTHYVRGRWRVTEVTTNRPWICPMQIHGSDTSPITSDLMRLQTEGDVGTSTNLSIVCRRSPVNGGSEIRTVLRTGYNVGDWVTSELRMQDGRFIIYLDGVEVMNVTGLAQIDNYFKAGCYLQDNVEKGADAADWGAVEYERGSFVTWHSGQIEPTTPVFTGASDGTGGPGGGSGNDTAPPTVPGSVLAVRGNNQIALSWAASTDNVGVDHYNVYRYSASSSPDPGSDPGNPTGGSGGPLTDRTSVSYNNGVKTSTYHIYADDLDWAEPVGLLVYGDGSGEQGLIDPADDYLMAGTNGLIAVAKRHNMVLVTPRAPGNGCLDGDGVCWYDDSFNGTTVAQKTEWLDDLIQTQVLALYDIDVTRVCIAGFSSGAENTMGLYGPQYAASWMEDGLLLAISYGSSPDQYGVTDTYTSGFRAAVACVWDVRGGDETTALADSQEGYDWYDAEGFATIERNVIPGGQHDRPGEFGSIVDTYITRHVRAVGATAGTSSVLGNDTGGSSTTLSSSDKIVASRFTAEATGVLTEGHFRAWLSASGTTNSKMMVYADSSSAPGALLATSDQIAITATAETVQDYPFTGAAQITITSGVDYWLAVAWDDPGTPSVTYSRSGTTGGRVESTATYGTPPDPFGTLSGTFTGPVDVWADVVAGSGAGTGGGGSITSFGKVTDGASSSASSADKTAVSSATASANGTLVAGHARVWLSGTGSATTKAVLYADSGGAPGARLATSDPVVITNTAEAEVDYTFSGADQVAITNGTTYWVGVAWVDPGTVSLNISRDNTASGRQEVSSYAPTPFGTPTALTGPIDVYLDTTSGTGGGASGSFVAIATVTAPTTTYTNTGLTNGVEYTYAISAEDAAGNESELSASVSRTPGPPDTTAPTVPTGLAVTAGDGRASLTWTASTDADGEVLRYNVYIDGVQQAQVAAGEGLATALVFVGLTNGTELDFTVSAVDDSLNESSQSSVVSATPTAPTLDGVPLLPGRLVAGRIEVAIAWGADLTAAEGTWTWTDETDKVRQDPGISASLGRNDEASGSNPASLTLVLDNPDHYFSLGGRSPNWPYVRRGTPVRVRVDPGDGTGPRVVLQGNADGFTPGWDGLTGNIPVVALSVSGTLRRLAQGSAPLQSVYRRVMAASSATVAYWPLEENKGATYAPALIGGGDFTLTGDPDWGANTDLDCSAALPTLRTGRLVADVDTYTNTGATQIRWLMSIPDSGLTDGTVLAHISTSGGIHRWDLTYGITEAGATNLGLYRYNAPAIPGTLNSFNIVSFDLSQGFVGRFSLEMRQSGSDIAFTYSITPDTVGSSSLFFSGTIAGKTVGIITEIDLNPHSAKIDAAFGHVTVENAISSAFSDVNALNAMENEYALSATGRLTRLCQENAVPLVRYTGGGLLSTLETMGPQLVAPLLTLLAECEAVDQGQLWDGRSAGLAYTTRRRRERGTVALTVDAAAGELAEGFAPTDDDQRTRNRWEVSLTRGVTVVREDTVGPLGTDTIGIYDDAATINNRNDSMARQYASWFVAQGTVEGYRYPSVTVDLAASPHLAAAVLDVIPGDRIEVTGLDDTLAGFPTANVSLVVEGIAHELTTRSWRATFRCSPFEPWAVGEVAAATGDTSDMVMRCDTDGSTVNTTAAAGATSLSVASSGVRWTTAADDYPLHLSVGGVKVRATACSGSSSPQTMTVDPLPVARASGLPIKLWEPRRIGLG